MNRVGKTHLLITLAVLILFGIIIGLSQIYRLAPVDPVPTPIEVANDLLRGNNQTGVIMNRTVAGKKSEAAYEHNPFFH